MPGADKLNWRTLIVDLMKLLNLDSSLDSRKQLAQELSYRADTSDSAKMNPKFLLPRSHFGWPNSLPVLRNVGSGLLLSVSICSH